MVRKLIAIAAGTALGVGAAVWGTVALAGTNGSGTYSLPNAAFVTGTSISSTVMNSNFSDVSAALTDRLDRTGKGSMSAALKLYDGSVSAPGMSFANETGTGFYRAGAGDLRCAVSGTAVFQVTSSAMAATGTNASFPTIRGNRAAGDTGSDVVISSTATRTAGKVFDVQNNGTTAFYVGAANGTAITPSAVNLPQYVYITSNQTFTTIADITGFAFSIAANADYEVRGFLMESIGNDTGTINLTGPAAPTSVFCDVAYQGGGSGFSQSNASAFAADMVAMAANNTTGSAHLQCVIRNGANAGTIQLRAKSTAGAQTLTIKAGSWFSIRRMDAPY